MAKVEEGEKIEKVLDSRDGPVGFVGNQTILYNDAGLPALREGEETERQVWLKILIFSLFLTKF